VPRYKLVVEYDGTPYTGWQAQAEGRSVQQALEAAVAAFAGERVRAHCAGRTDAGVHATHQVVHLDLARDWRTDTVRDAANAHLRPAPVVVRSAERVAAEFDARRSAVRRHYLYRILNRRPPPALDRSRVWHVPWPLDAAAMHAAAQVLVGRHDFTTFRAAECQASGPVRTLERLDVAREGGEGGEEIRVSTAARSFLHHQVRSMVGTLMLVGGGRMTRDGLAAALAARDRARCGPMAPACGLVLCGVDYP
jgi:tRNA pseudouridine38-40 synthase